MSTIAIEKRSIGHLFIYLICNFILITDCHQIDRIDRIDGIDIEHFQVGHVASITTTWRSGARLYTMIDGENKSGAMGAAMVGPVRAGKVFFGSKP